MKKYVCYLFVIFMATISCNTSDKQAASKQKEDSIAAKQIQQNSERSFTIKGVKDPTVQNGENIEYYDNKVIKIRGMMKDGKRDGVWKSWYQDGTPWSETTFSEGKKQGKTTTWYENGKMRYQGTYSNDVESGTWTFWDEKGTQVQTKDYDKK